MHLFLQGLRVESNPSSGVRILAGGKNLVLQGIRRHHSGNYTCTAFNLEGEDTSNPVAITVMCKLRHFLFEQFWPWREAERKAKPSKQEGGKMGSFRRLYLFVMRYEVFETVSRCCQSKHLCSPSTKDTNSSPFRTINYGRVGHNFLLLMGTSNENPRLKLAQSRMDGDQVFNSKEFWGWYLPEEL